MGDTHGHLLSALPMDADWSNWEMHPAGDEILFLVSGLVRPFSLVYIRPQPS